MRLVSYIIIASTNFLSSYAFAQEQHISHMIGLKGGTSLYKDIYEMAWHHTDALSRLNRKGVLFFRFGIEEDGRTREICVSDGGHVFRTDPRSDSLVSIGSAYKAEPSLLVRKITAILRAATVSTVDGASLGELFVLPVRYDYVSAGPVDIGAILEQMPKIDLDKLCPEDKQDEFDALFDISSDGMGIWGVRCVMLPWISLRRKIE